MNDVVLGVNFWERGPAQQLCRTSLVEWAEKYPSIHLVSPRIAGDGYCPSEFSDLPVLKTLCSDVIQGSKKRKPLVHEMFDALATRAVDDDTLLVLSNSDIWFSEQAIQGLTGTSAIGAAFSRVQFSPINYRTEQASFVHDFPNGFDVFAVRAGWWKDNRKLFLHLPCIYAERAWDNAYACVLKAYGGAEWLNKSPLVFHFPHEVRWASDSLEGNYCGQLWTRCGWEIPWNLYTRQAVSRREYVSGRISPASLAVELRVEKSLFTPGGEQWLPGTRTSMWQVNASATTKLSVPDIPAIPGSEQKAHEARRRKTYI